LEIANGANVAATACTKCKPGFNITNGACVKKMMVTVTGKEYYLPDLVRNCLIFNFTTYECKHCRGDAWKVDGNLCCHLKQKLEGNKCVDPKDAAEELANESLIKKVPNCVTYELNKCIECQ
jgi:hypothetical protein